MASHPPYHSPYSAPEVVAPQGLLVPDSERWAEYPPGTRHQSPGNAAKKTICGLRRTTFELVAVIVVLIIAGAIWGGVGGSMANRTASSAHENSVCTSTQIFTATTTTTITATAQPSCSPTYNATASPGKYACQCLTSSKSVNANATASICSSFSSSGEPVCYPLSHLPLLLSFYITTFILITRYPKGIRLLY